MEMGYGSSKEQKYILSNLKRASYFDQK